MYIWGKGRAAGRVGSDFLSAIAGRVGSGQRFAGSGRVGPRKVTRGQLWDETVSQIFDSGIWDLICLIHNSFHYIYDHQYKQRLLV